MSEHHRMSARLASDVPSIRWSPSGVELGPSECDLLPLAGSPSVSLPEEFLQGVTSTLAGTRMPASGSDELRSAIARRVQSVSGVAVDPKDEVVVTNGAMHALDCVFRALIPRGGRVGMLCPTFFADRLLDEETEVVRFDTRRADGWHVDARLLEEIRRTPLDAFFLVNPNNPTGVVYKEHELRALVEATSAAGTLLIVDEAYEAFVYEGRRHVSVMGLEGARDRLVTVQSFTKSFGLVAARMGCAFGPAHLIAGVARLLGWVSLASNPLPQALAVAALETAETWRPALVEQFAANRRLLAAAVDAGALPVGTSVPEGATFSMLDISRLGIGSESAATLVWQKTGIACVPGIEFPGDLAVTDGFLRLPIGAPEPVFREALDRLAEFFVAR